MAARPCRFKSYRPHHIKILKHLIFDLDGVITTEATYWDIARRGLLQLLSPTADPLPLDFIYWVKNHAINHNWDVAFVALTAAPDVAKFCATHDALTGKSLLESCPGYRAAPWREVHAVCQAIQDASPLPSAGLHTPAETQKLFAQLKRQGFDFAVATGRPRAEALAPLDALGIRHFFPENRIVTHLDVEQAEHIVGTPLGKPHPFVALRAMYPEMLLQDLLNLPPKENPGVYFIGDTASDISAALAAGVTPVGILTALPPGPYREERRQTLRNLGCDNILDSVLDLPHIKLDP